MRIYANSESDPKFILGKLAIDMVNLLEDEGIDTVKLVDYKLDDSLPVGIINIGIGGDWRHDHERADQLIKNNFHILRCEEAEEDFEGDDDFFAERYLTSTYEEDELDEIRNGAWEYGPDWYPSIHTYYVSARF